MKLKEILEKVLEKYNKYDIWHVPWSLELTSDWFDEDTMKDIYGNCFDYNNQYEYEDAPMEEYDLDFSKIKEDHI